MPPMGRGLNLDKGWSGSFDSVDDWDVSFTGLNPPSFLLRGDTKGLGLSVLGLTLEGDFNAASNREGRGGSFNSLGSLTSLEGCSA